MCNPVLALLLLAFAGASQDVLDNRQLAATVAADPLALWKFKAANAAQVVEEALRRQDSSKSVEVKHVDLEALRIWHGQRLELALEVDGSMFSFFTESEPEWHSLGDALPAAPSSQVGAVVPRTDWEALERNWVAPITQGPQLPDFVLEGPLDLYLRKPTALQLFLPHPVDVGGVGRVLLREGAAVTVRGARSVGLRRPVDMPALSLADFASLVTADAEEHPAAGILHLVAGVRQAAVQRWNQTHPDLSLAVVALELDFSPHAGALLSAPAPGSSTGRQGLQRLKPRKLKEGVVELSPRDSMSEEESKALALAGGAPYAWPLRNAHPQHLQAYEHLLREVLSSQVFSTQRGAGGSSSSGLHVQQDLQLRLHKTQAEATTLLQLRLEVERRLKPSAEPGSAKVSGREGSEGGAAEADREASRSGATEAGASGRVARGPGSREGSSPDSSSGGGGSSSSSSSDAVKGEAGAALERPPDTLALLVEPKFGPYEVWDAVVQVKREPDTGTLRFVPVRVQRVESTPQSVSFSPSAINSMVGNFSSEALAALMGAQRAREEL